MDHYHIAFVNHAAPPHINPTLSLVSSLVRRGCRVSYVTSRRFQGTIADLGAECTSFAAFDVGEEAVPVARRQQWWTWDQIAEFYRDFVIFADRLLPELMARYEIDRPDLIVYDSLMFAGRVLAKRWDIPAVQMTPIFAYHDVYFTRRSGSCYTPHGFVEFGEVLDNFFNQHDVGGKNHLYHKEALNIHFFPKAFQFAAGTFDERFLFAGSCIAERPSQGDWKRTVSGGRPVILVSASTTSYCTTEYFEVFMEALKDLPWDVVMATGDPVGRASFNRVPHNMEVHQYLPYPKVLPEAWLNICHGGTSTIVESLHHGVALICISQSAEPAEYSNRVAELGVGIHINQTDLSAVVLREAVLKIASDSELQQRVKEIQKAIHQENVGAEEVADRLIKHLACIC